MIERKAIYDIHSDFYENMERGPIWEGEFPEVLVPENKVDLLGHQLNSSFGVAASPLTADSRYIELLAKLGYDVLTYKSVRSVEWHGNEFPHWTHVLPPAILANAILGNFVVTDIPVMDQEPTMANSFGIHSQRPEVWQEDVEAALSKLSPHQMMILSLMCTPQPGQTLVDDAKHLAKLAAATSVTDFELNLACPNTDGGAGLIYEDIEKSVEMATAMKNVFGNKKLLVKVGRYQDQKNLKKFMRRTKGIIDGISSTNTYSAKVTKKDGSEFFPGRGTAGISGAVIAPYSQEQAVNILKFSDELVLPGFTTIGIGGVTKSYDIEKYYAIGVDAVQSVVGVYRNPLLASQWKKE